MDVESCNKSDGVISFSYQHVVWPVSMKKTLAHISHLVMTVIKLSETARKLQKTDKNTQDYTVMDRIKF